MLQLLVCFILVTQLLPFAHQTKAYPRDITITSHGENHLEKTIYTFATNDSFLNLDPQVLWPLGSKRDVHFKFRTDRPNGLLLYHTLTSPAPGFPIYELYLMLENGRLKVIHEFGKSEELLVGKGLNHDRWHEVILTITLLSSGGTVTVQIDDKDKTVMELKALRERPFYAELPDYSPPATLYFGGLDPNNPIGHQQYTTTRFVGCLGEIKLQYWPHSGQPKKRLGDGKQPVKASGLSKDCQDNCKRSSCFSQSRCVNHYTHHSCDCFGTKMEGPSCWFYNRTTNVFRGYSYITYKIYNWRDRIYSDLNRIGLQFKTSHGTSVLMYGAGVHPERNYFLLALFKGSVYLELDFGDILLSASLGEGKLADDRFHSCSVKHQGRRVVLSVDEDEVVLEVPLEHRRHHLFVDPDIFVAGLPPVQKVTMNNTDLKAHHKFIGCMQSVYFNRNNILYDLHREKGNARYIGVYGPEKGCESVTRVPLTFPTLESHLNLNSEVDVLRLSFEFKTKQPNVVLASGSFDSKKADEKVTWLLYLKERVPYFTILKNETVSRRFYLKKSLTFLENYWQHIAVNLERSGKLAMIFNHRFILEEEYPEQLTLVNPIKLGAGNTFNETTGEEMDAELEGFVGCLRDVLLNEQRVDVREAVESEGNVRLMVTLDNCQLVNPCDNPAACEHGGRCVVSKDGKTECDCNDTGYMGKSCHFALYKRTCKELYLVGYRKTGTYVVDIDRNGPLPPAHVDCFMSADVTQTIINHNALNEMIVRKSGLENFYMDIEYREFSPQMIRALIRHSKQCFQSIKYECKSTILGLGDYTWMNSASNKLVTSIGSDVSGRCACSGSRSCSNQNETCNCDSLDADWQSDSGDLTNESDIGITRAYFLQLKNATRDAQARFLLGPVKCLDSHTQEYVITFKTKESYLMITGWEKGDLAFSFRTSQSNAVLLYQAALHPGHACFKAYLINDYILEFEYTVNGVAKSARLVTNRKLNSGEWQQVWVDYDAHHMRFTINLISLVIDLASDEEFGPFEGPLYIGGIPGHLTAKEDKVTNGFLGCFRGLVIDNKIIDVHQHLSRKAPGIVKGCSPSCTDTMCLNGATCLEYWGSYECVCSNPIAHSGKNCEQNINSNGVTFDSEGSYLHELSDHVLPILVRDIKISFRTHKQEALILYANDQSNNFVQLHVEEGKKVTFTFNSGREVASGSVNIGEKLTSGQVIQVKIVRTQSRTSLIVNGLTAVIENKLLQVTKYEQKPWTSGEELELVRPARPSYPVEAHSQLFLGFVDDLSATSKAPPFIGCLQGLQIDGKLFDLEMFASRRAKDVQKQVKVGCRLLCESRTCANRGLCVEDWTRNQTSCNCDTSSYKGETCQKDIGAKFGGLSIVQFSFDYSAKQPLASVHIRLAFSAEYEAFPYSSSIKRILILVHLEATSNYILIAQTADGGLIMEEDDGSEQIISSVVMKDKKTFSDGWRHWLIYHRDPHQKKLIVDEDVYPLVRVSKKSRKQLENLSGNRVFVGGIDKGSTKFKNLDNYIGCISNVRVQLNSIVIEPLDSAFSGVNLKQVTVTNIMQRKCAEFRPIIIGAVTPPPVQPPPMKSERWTPKPPKLIGYTPKHNRFESKPTKRFVGLNVFIICLAFLTIVFTSVGIYMYRLHRKYQIKKFKGDTPFFHGNSRHNSTTSRSETRFARIPGVNDDSEAAARLLQYQPEAKSTARSTETHPLKESKQATVSFSSEPIQEKEEEEEEESSEHSIHEEESSLGSGKPLTAKKRKLKPSSSQELKWDLNADNPELNPEMNVSEIDLRLRSQAPLASFSETSLNVLPSNQ